MLKHIITILLVTLFAVPVIADSFNIFDEYLPTERKKRYIRKLKHRERVDIAQERAIAHEKITSPAQNPSFVERMNEIYKQRVEQQECEEYLRKYNQAE
jgi:hypothetical protein